MVDPVDLDAIETSTGPTRGRSDPEESLIPLSALNDLFAEMANLQRAAAAAAERAGRAEERETFQTQRRQEVEAQLSDLQLQLADAKSHSVFRRRSG
jgi:hypothetical protein